jgi:RHS repeat-associated protein
MARLPSSAAFETTPDPLSFFDGLHCWFNVWADLDGNNSNALLTRYFHGDQPDQLFARQDALTAYWYLTDRQGSVRDVLDSSANVKDAISYDGWGNIVSETDSTKRGLYAWTGRLFDVETKLQNNRRRWYDPATARWMSQDPMGFDAGDSNLYRYANNNPGSFTDPSGQRVRVYFFEGIGGTVKTPFTFDFLKVNFLTPFLKKYANADFFYNAQDTYLGAEEDIKSNKYTWGEEKKDGKCVNTYQKNRVVLIGYSAGGDAVSRMTHDLEADNISIDLAFTVDPVLVFRAPPILPIPVRMITGPAYSWMSFPSAPDNVLRWVNFYQRTDTKTMRGFFPPLWTHGIWGFPIPGATEEKELTKTDFNNASDAANGHRFIPGRQFIINAWDTELGKISKAALADPVVAY